MNNKKLIFIYILLSISCIFAFIFAFNQELKPINENNIDQFKVFYDYLKDPFNIFVIKVFSHNFLLNLVQALLTMVSFGYLGIIFLFNNFYTYGFVFKITNNPFLFLEMLGTIFFIFSSTWISYNLKKVKTNKILIFLLICSLIFLIAAILEGRYIYK